MIDKARLFWQQNIDTRTAVSAAPVRGPAAGPAPGRPRIALADRLYEVSGTPPAGTPDGQTGPDAAAGWVSSACIARRLAGLEAVLADTDRYARLIARRLTAPARGGRTSPIQPGRPPGLPDDPYDLDGSALALAHSGALCVLNGPP